MSIPVVSSGGAPLPAVGGTNGITLTSIPREVLALAEQVAKIHGSVRVSREANGLHIYCASPACLERYGRSELFKKHLAINAEKALGVGDYLMMRGTYDADRVARCMKTGTAYSLSELMRMEPLEKRGIRDVVPGTVQISDSHPSLVRDAAGNLIPAPPGETIPLTQLPATHPARLYLASRRFDAAALEKQFAASWCEVELSEDASVKRFYRRLVGGFKDTPQGRIIFNADVNGVRVAWQGRILDMVVEKEHLYWHPYERRWVVVSRLQGDKWVELPGWEGFDPSKYKTSLGAKRNQLVMGFDAAVAWNAKHRPHRPVFGLTEGPLDAGRFGPPFCAILGKVFSPEQSRLVAGSARRLLYISQNDKAGLEARERVIAGASMFLSDIIPIQTPTPFKDPGEMDPEDALNLVKDHL